MSSETAIHKRNLDSSILFMQQEHASTLKCLHEEIGQLQKRCTDLTFQLTMHGLTIDEPGSIDTQMQQVHQDLEGSRSRITELEKELSDRDKRVERLETEAKAQRKRWLDESRAQSQAMNTLRAELEAKANNIAYLTTELHRLKSKQNVGSIGGGGEDGTQPNKAGATSQPTYLNAGDSAGKRPTHVQQFAPAPPQRERSSFGQASRIRRSGGHSRSLAGSSVGVAQGKSLHQSAHPVSADAHLVRQHHQVTASSTLRLSSGRSSGSESPDITPFLPPTKEDAVVHGKQAPVLPPISSTSLSPRGLRQPVPPSAQVIVHKVVSSGSQHRQLKASGQASTAPITTLAVENAAANKSDSAWALETHGAEYN